jgi:sulfate permease, SulP family
MRIRLRYSPDALRRDAVAALTVTAIALPQGMAYALLAGVDPRYGLYSTIVVTALASVFGSSSHLINGPTSAISLVVFAALSAFDPDQRVEAAEAMFLLGVMVGSIQILTATFRLGDLTRYISESVILGFMSAAALLLARGQVSNAVGVRDKGTGAQHILHRLWLTLTNGDPVNVKAVITAVATLAFAIAFRGLVRRYRLPRFDMLAALVIVGVGTYLAGWTIQGPNGKAALAVAGIVTSSLPAPHIPTVKLSWARDFAPDSMAIAVLGLLEALAIAKSIANETRQPLDFNRQCLAEGIANLAGGFFQCLPGSGSLTRSAINFQAGAETRFSGILSSGFIAIALVSLAPLAQYVPKPSLAALLLLTAARLIDLKRIAYTFRASRMDASIALVTAASALAFGLDQAILIGVALSILLFVPRAAKLKTVELVVDEDEIVRERLPSDPDDAGFLLFDLKGEVFFGAAPELERTFAEIRRRAHRKAVRHVLVRIKRMRNPDVVSLEQFEQFLREADAGGNCGLARRRAARSARVLPAPGLRGCASERPTLSAGGRRGLRHLGGDPAYPRPIGRREGWDTGQPIYYRV